MTIRDYLTLTRRAADAGSGAPTGNGPSGPSAPTPPPPTWWQRGAIDIAAGGRFTMRLAGWALPAEPGGPTVVRITEYRSTSGYTILTDTTATLPRPDAPDGARGFDVTLPALGGTHSVCLVTVNPATGARGDTLGCPYVEVDSGAPADPLPADAGWLQTLNYYRTSAGVGAVTEDPARTDAITKHLIYLRDTPKEYFTGEYANLHRENPASPYYTPEGAGYSHNVLTWSQTERAAIEGWMTAPFHALNQLSPKYNTAAFDLLDGIAAALTITTPPAPPDITAPVSFPGNGAVTPLRRFTGESPDPRDPCPTPSSWYGLPLIVVFPTDPPPGGTASMVLPDGSSVPPGDLCVVSRHNYVPSDPIYGPAGYSILSNNNAVLVIPRQPLTPGTHSVRLTLPGLDPVEWSFTVSR